MTVTNSKPPTFDHARQSMRRDIVARRQFHLPFSPGSSMSTSDVAKLLNCSTETVRKMIEEDELVAYQLRPGLAGSPFRVYKDSVAKLLANIRKEYNLDDLTESPAPSANSANPANSSHPTGKPRP